MSHSRTRLLVVALTGVVAAACTSDRERVGDARLESAPAKAPDSARRALIAAVAEQRLSARLVLEAWLERDNERRGLPAGELARVFRERVATAERYGEVHTGPLSARLGALKQELVAKRGIQYNREASTLAHFLLDDRLQCHSGSIAVVLAWTTSQRAAAAHPVFVHTSGHVQPGLLVGGTLLVAEATATDAVVHKHRLARIRDTRVTSALDELALALVPEPPTWLRQRALIRDTAPEGVTTSRSPDGSPFGFGEADVTPGDLPLPRETPDQGPPRYGEEPETESDGERAGLIAVSGGRGGAAPIFASEPSASGVFNLVFCEDVRPWKRLQRADLRALERDLVGIFGSDLSRVRVSQEENCALVGQLPGFEFGTASAEVRLMVRDGDSWRQEERATIATVRMPRGCQFNWKFCALKPPKSVKR